MASEMTESEPGEYASQAPHISEFSESDDDMELEEIEELIRDLEEKRRQKLMNA
jgi:hypothetical protein